MSARIFQAGAVYSVFLNLLFTFVNFDYRFKTPAKFKVLFYHFQELLSYLNVLFKTVNLEVTNGDRIHLANLALMAYFQQALATEASFIDDLRTKLKDFLDNNQWFDECLAIRLAAEVRILCLKFSLNPLRFSLTRETDNDK